MGKHSKHNDLEVKYKKIIFLIIIIILFTIITIYNAQRENRQKSGQSNLNYQNINEEMLNDIIVPVNNNKYQSILTDISIENEKLVLQSLSNNNTIIEYQFKENLVEKIIVYEKFEKKEEFYKKKEIYSQIESIKLLYIDEKNMSIEFEKNDKGTDANLSYQEVYDKYLIRIVGGYKLIE